MDGFWLRLEPLAASNGFLEWKLPSAVCFAAACLTVLLLSFLLSLKAVCSLDLSWSLRPLSLPFLP